MNEPAAAGAGARSLIGGEATATAGAHREGFRKPADRVTVPAWLAALALIAITVIAYLPVWDAGFIWDDDVMLTRNPFVQSPDGLSAIWFSTELPDYFPLTSTALWLQWQLWGADPFGYHLVNVLLHGLAAVLWWRVFRRLGVPGAWVIAAVFALHPVNVESVAWVTELKNALAMVFYAAAVLAYLRFEDADASAGTGDVGPGKLGRGTWYGLALVAFTLALLSKTAVTPLPAALLVLAWWRRRRIAARDVWRTVPFFALSAVLSAVTLWFHHHRAIAGTIVRDDDFVTRIAGAGWALWFYLSKVLVPTNLTFVYPRWQIDGRNVLVYVPAILAVALAAWCWRYRATWGRHAAAAFGYFVLLLLPVLGFIDISYMRHSLVADRWQYFAVIAPIAIVVGGVAAFWPRRARSPVALAVVSGVLLVGLGALTWRQSRMYVDVDTLWRTTLARNPDCAVAYNEVGTSLLHADRIDEAIAHYEKSLALLPDYTLAHHNYGCALLKRGQHADAIARFRRALSHQADFLPAQHYLGRALLEAGEVDEAIRVLEAALVAQPDFAESHYHLGGARMRQERWDDAIACFERTIALAPESVQAHNDLGVALIRTGNAAEALRHFQTALELDPNSAEAHNNVARVLQIEGRWAEAVRHFEASLQLQPEDVDTLANLAWLLSTAPETPVRNAMQAIVLAQRANQRERRDDPVVLRALAAAFAEAGRFAEATAAATRGVGRARQLGAAELVAALESDLRHYADGAPVREPADRERTVAP